MKSTTVDLCAALDAQSSVGTTSYVRSAISDRVERRSRRGMVSSGRPGHSRDSPRNSTRRDFEESERFIYNTLRGFLGVGSSAADVGLTVPFDAQGR